MQRPAARAEFQHIAEHGYAPAARADLGSGPSRESEAAIGGGIGIIAVVDEERGAAGSSTSSRVPRPDAGWNSASASAASARSAPTSTPLANTASELCTR